MVLAIGEMLTSSIDWFQMCISHQTFAQLHHINIRTSMQWPYSFNQHIICYGLLSTQGLMFPLTNTMTKGTS
jgi:hypothetical protein